MNLGCNKNQFPIKYFGLSLRLGRFRRDDWNNSLDRLNGKLEGWKRKILSLVAA